MVNGYRVDFWWPDLGLVVETDGLTYTAPLSSKPPIVAGTRLTPRPG